METLAQHLWIGFVGGLLAFAHCLGMCGGFVLHLSQGKGKKAVVTVQLLWLAGKSFSYLFLGAVAGYAGGFLGTLLARQGVFQNLLSYAAGGVIVLMGLSLLGLLPVGQRAQGGIGESLLAPLSRKFLPVPLPRRPRLSRLLAAVRVRAKGDGDHGRHGPGNHGATAAARVYNPPDRDTFAQLGPAGRWDHTGPSRPDHGSEGNCALPSAAGLPFPTCAVPGPRRGHSALLHRRGTWQGERQLEYRVAPVPTAGCR
jgi:hypothetical protein